MKIFGKRKSSSAKATEDKEKEPQKMAEAADEKKLEIKIPEGKDVSAYMAIKQPHITEKAASLEALNKYIFRVFKNSNKSLIKKAVENLYKAAVKDVKIINMPSKFRRLGQQEGQRPGYKKAIVTLKKGNKIKGFTQERK